MSAPDHPGVPAAGGMDFETVRRLLPQSFPLLLVDRVTVCEAGRRLAAYKNVSGNDLHFLGHFPGRAVMPGALMLEALAQACVLLFQATYGALAAGEMPVFGSVKARFLRPVVPGDRLELEAEVVKMTSSAGLFRVAARVGAEVAVRGELSMARTGSAGA